MQITLMRAERAAVGAFVGVRFRPCKRLATRNEGHGVGQTCGVLLSTTAESFLVYTLFHFIRESIPAFRMARTRTAHVRHGMQQVLPLEFMGPVSTLVWSASGWNHSAYDALATTPRASSRRR
jgi:hypothetical protein